MVDPETEGTDDNIRIDALCDTRMEELQKSDGKKTQRSRPPMPQTYAPYDLNRDHGIRKEEG